MIESMMQDVECFLKEVVGLELPTRPQMLMGDRLKYATDHLYEEYEEFREAETLEGQLDALVDLTYVALGRILEMGISPSLAFDAVHEANMTKKPGVNPSRPNVEQDAVKPEDWQSPDFAKALAASTATLDDWDTQKILIIGHAQHGKDTVGEILRDKYSMTFTSSSMFCAEHVIWPLTMKGKLRDRFVSGLPHSMRGLVGIELQLMHLGYKNLLACFEDRADHRALWYEAIRDFNRPDASALGRAIFAENDIYVGLRSKAELNALKNSGAVDHIIWVDRSDHLPPEDASSCTVEPWMADYVLDNNGTLENLEFNVQQLMERLL